MAALSRVTGEFLRLQPPTFGKNYELSLSPPSLDDLIRLLKAWRFWVFGALRVPCWDGTVLLYCAAALSRTRNRQRGLQP